MAGASGALAGVRVVDLTRVLAGPWCTMLLGDMGADVIKVEPTGTGDDTRSWGPPFVGGEAAYFLGVNRNKRSVTLNLGSEPGREILESLVRRSDVLVENLRPGTLERWGITAAWLEAEAPQVIRCSITGYGTTGPRAALPGYDFILQAECGLMSISGEPDGAPMKYGVAIVDLATGMLASSAILGALTGRQRTGRGQTVEVSLWDSGLALLANVAANHLATGRDARRFGNGHPNIVPYNSYPARDAMIAVAVGNDAQFVRFAAAVGHPEWAADARFTANQSRVVHRETLDALIADVLGRDFADAWTTRLRAAEVPCGRVQTVAQALSDPHTAAREMVRTVQHATAGEVKMLGLPVRMSDTPTAIHRPPPALGQHTEEVLRDELGYDAERVAALRRQGVI